ncbi:MAG TPA: ABC transporter ATP-binding protein [Firmicutes bacterium]|nr:ABC transporter ATP-binding protein [Bacillota bacterium]
MIELRSVSKSYARSDKPAVDSLDLEVKNGEVFGFLGPNGAGKTTTIKMIIGLLRPDRGSIRVEGIDVVKNPISAKRVLGYVPDDVDIWDKVTGREYIRFLASVYGVDSKNLERVNALLDAFELSPVIDDIVQNYSHGMKQKLAIIGSLVHNPPVWILDEPIVGLDPRSSFILKGLMRSHASSGGTVFFSTHVLEIAERICDTIGIIHKGKLIAAGTLEQVKELFASKENQSLEELFLEITGAKLPPGTDRIPGSLGWCDV